MPKLTLSFKGQTISVHRLQDGKTLIGRDPDCDIAIDSLAVAPRHAELITEAEVCRVVALNEQNPTLVNENEIEETALTHGDVLRLGKHTLMYASDGVSLGPQTSESDAVAGTGSNNKAGGSERGTTYLQILSGEHIGRIIPVTRNMIRIGKAGGDCAIIAHRGNGYYLSHLEGIAPTVDGVPIGEESIMLTKGSTIRISSTELQFYC